MIQKLKESQIKTNSTNYKQFLHFSLKSAITAFLCLFKLLRHIILLSVFKYTTLSVILVN